MPKESDKLFMAEGGSVTRGHGLLEEFLSRMRARMANKKIPKSLRSGRILDVGCGAFPYFLTNVDFADKFGIDQNPVEMANPTDQSGRAMHLVQHNIQAGNGIPFESEYFSVITMLAVVEHLEPATLSKRISELRNLLQPGGRLIITTPAGWTHGLLKIMSRVGLVSREEIDEHEFQYSGRQLREVIMQGGFGPEQVKIGYFELFMNIWCVCDKR